MRKEVVVKGEGFFFYDFISQMWKGHKWLGNIRNGQFCSLNWTGLGWVEKWKTVLSYKLAIDIEKKKALNFPITSWKEINIKTARGTKKSTGFIQTDWSDKTRKTDLPGKEYAERKIGMMVEELVKFSSCLSS
jgi:hypothetical protein